MFSNRGAVKPGDAKFQMLRTSAQRSCRSWGCPDIAVGAAVGTREMRFGTGLQREYPIWTSLVRGRSACQGFTRGEWSKSRCSGAMVTATSTVCVRVLKASPIVSTIRSVHLELGRQRDGLRSARCEGPSRLRLGKRVHQILLQLMLRPLRARLVSKIEEYYGSYSSVISTEGTGGS